MNIVKLRRGGTGSSPSFVLVWVLKTSTPETHPTGAERFLLGRCVIQNLMTRISYRNEPLVNRAVKEPPSKQSQCCTKIAASVVPGAY